jgi:hypothetical protein
MREKEVIRLPAGCKGGGVSAYGRIGVSACSWGVGRWFLGAQRSGGEQLAADLLICYLIQRLPASGVRN